MISFQGLLNILSLCLIALCIICMVRVLKNSKTTGLSGQRVIVLFALVSFLFNTFVFVFSEDSFTARYYIPIVIMYIPVLAIFLHQAVFKLDRILVSIFLCCMLLFPAYIIPYASKNTVTVNNALNEQREASINYLVENDYDFGYATFWDAGIVEELSNGQVEVANIMQDEDLGLRPFLWLTPQKYYEAGYHVGKTFLLLTKEEEAQLLPVVPALQEMTKEYEDDFFVIYTSDSGEVMEEALGIS